MEKTYREIIVYKLHSQPQNESLGFLRVVAEQKGGDYTPLNAKNFCYSEKVFVTADYEEINKRYQKYELFKITVSKSSFIAENISPDRNCTYVALGTKTSPIKPKELIEVVECPLPNASEAEIILPYVPSTTYLYLQDNDMCYGPFKWKSLGEEGKISIQTIKSPLPGRSLPIGRIFSGKMSDLDYKHAIHCHLQDDERIYFKNLADLHNDTFLSSMDYYSDAEIVNNFIKVTKEMNFRGSQNQTALTFLLQRVRQNPATKHAKQLAHINRISEMANEQELFDEEVMNSFNRFLQTEKGQKIVKRYIEDNKITYLADLKSGYQAQLEVELEVTLKQLDTIKKELMINTQQLQQVNSEIEEANQLMIQAQLEENREQITYLDNEIELKTTQLSQLTEDCKVLTDKYQQYYSLDEVTQALHNLQTSHQEATERNQYIQQQMVQLETLYQLSEDKLKNKLIELKPFVEVIHRNIENTPAQSYKLGQANKQSLATIEVSADEKLTVTVEELANIDINFDIIGDMESDEHKEKQQQLAHSILQSIKKSFELEHRNLSMMDVINLVVTIQQSFISFLAGLPGGGKTTLARIIAKVQGIQQQRFLEIPISRGWTGQKDLIGFFNPIVNKFQPSSTGLYEFLYALSEESKQTKATPLSMVLLDEANLSPMEYYWSSFMSLSDGNPHKEIQLEDSRLVIPDNLRFVSTINYDNTTEHLSPRMIDRAPIIVLEPNTLAISPDISIDNASIASDSVIKVDEPIFDKPIAYEVMETLFGSTKSLPNLTENEQQLYQKIKTLLEKRDNDLGKPILISNRKEVAIRQYCHKARPLMQFFTPTYTADNLHQANNQSNSQASFGSDFVDDNCEIATELLAMDFAVLQFILPLLKGHGQPFRERLIQLQDILQEYQLQRSNQYLDMMIGNGDTDLRTYDFFCW